MFIKLSHTMRVGDPAFGGPMKLKVQQLSSFKEGPAQTFLITLSNHDGTHIDAPNHFNPDGRVIADFTLDELTFSSPILLDIPKNSPSLITVEEIASFGGMLEGRDILLIRTGYGRFRRTDPNRYSRFSPCLSPEAARFIVEELKSVRCIGVDMVSIGSPAFPQETVETHRILTGYYGSRPVLIIEDMDLEGELTGLRRVIVVPLYVEGIDSAPCTVLGEI